DDDILGLAERVYRKFGRCPHDLDALFFRIAFRFDLHQDGHAERVEVLRNLAHHTETLLGPEYRVLEFEFRCAARLDPLKKKVPEILPDNRLHYLTEILGRGGFPGKLLGISLEAGEKLLVPNHIAQHVENGRAFAAG